jgi:DNA invertase Pin-like site-specific DNA recombinase
MRAAIYARTNEAPGSADDRLAAQVARCRRMIEVRGWTLVDVVTEVRSGMETPKRLFTLLTDQGADIDVLVVVDLDRLGRNMEDMISAQFLMNRLGMQLAIA